MSASLFDSTAIYTADIKATVSRALVPYQDCKQMGKESETDTLAGWEGCCTSGVDLKLTEL